MKDFGMDRKKRRNWKIWKSKSKTPSTATSIRCSRDKCQHRSNALIFICISATSARVAPWFTFVKIRKNPFSKSDFYEERIRTEAVFPRLYPCKHCAFMFTCLYLIKYMFNKVAFYVHEDGSARSLYFAFCRSRPMILFRKNP